MRSRTLEDGTIETLETHYDQSEWPRISTMHLQRQAVERKLAMLSDC